MMITIVEVVIPLLLIISVLFQTRGSELGISMGSPGTTYRSKRGIEKFFFASTIILSILFASLAIFNLVVT